MQNRYTGDVGDFATFGLLRALCSPAGGLPALSLGVVWYLVPDENGNSDGRHVSYLQPTARNLELYARCDPSVYEALRNLVASGRRNVSAMQASGVLPPGAVCFAEPLSFDALPNTTERRLAHRRDWLGRALSATRDLDIVFLDPDNGLESGVQRRRKDGPKYAFYDEVAEFARRGQSVIVYQHMDRSAPAGRQAARRMSELEHRADAPAGVFGLRFRRGTGRFFFVLPQPRRRELLMHRAETFLAGHWSVHFDPVY